MSRQAGLKPSFWRKKTAFWGRDGKNVAAAKFPAGRPMEKRPARLRNGAIYLQLNNENFPKRLAFCRAICYYIL